ncbi:unnamed protein product [Cuscuta campestris]|uniref:Uncharacterized protein n=1 Tax=Cuscuta campestris TaxID=132261 RepID=A0A484NGH9_9ASTE|nr:unnamed protein product [Cuscuta campestris]
MKTVTILEGSVSSPWRSHRPSLLNPTATAAQIHSRRRSSDPSPPLLLRAAAADAQTRRRRYKDLSSSPPLPTLVRLHHQMAVFLVPPRPNP